MRKKLDKIAAAIERPRAWVCLRAPPQYLAGEGAEILDVREGIAQLDRGESAPLDDVMGGWRNWSPRPGQNALQADAALCFAIGAR
jgi:predicted transcriptional regulator